MTKITEELNMTEINRITRITDKLTDRIICPKDDICNNYDINNCNYLKCLVGYYLDNYKCFKCNAICKDYEVNSCKCKLKKMKFHSMVIIMVF